MASRPGGLLPRTPAGRWTLPAARPGEDGLVGEVLTRHEMLLDVIHLVRRLGWEDESPSQQRALMQVEVVHLGEGQALGTRHVTDAQLAEVLEQVAQRAFAWLVQRTPPGYRFSLDDGLRLNPVDDLTATQIAPEVLISAARARGIEVRRSMECLVTAHPYHADDGWIALHGPFRAAGPFATESEAVAAIVASHVELRNLLQANGATDIAASVERLVDV